MKLSELGSFELKRKLNKEGLRLDLFPFVIEVKSDCPSLARDIEIGYADFLLADQEVFCDFHLQIFRERLPFHFIRPLARFYFDGRSSFVPLAEHQAFTMFEWGLNWCIAAHCHDYLIIHAAVLERNGCAVLLPAPPGSGKSTLCAALANRGWRLLSDELALLSLETNEVYGMARPVNLKNQSISIIKDFEPAAKFTRVVPDTTKGEIALMQPPYESVLSASLAAKPRWIVVPKYLSGSESELINYPKGRLFMLLAEQSFNYDIHGQNGFNRVGQLLDECDTFQLTYSRLDEAVAIFDSISEKQ